ncbi:IS110 family transposase [Rhodococcus opacus]|nr:IS110 family transposase [Rhodococcus opacus]UNM98948.1 IS110 family transposase [Rhodococcus opacus]
MCWHAATFAGYTGTAPIEAFSGDVVRHRLSRAGDRQPNCALHTMAITQIGRDTPGRALLPNGNAPPERVTGKRCAAGRGGSRTSPVGSFSATRRELAADPGGHLGAALSPCAAG